MKLVDDWKVIAKKAWSMRFVFFGVALGVAEQFVPTLQGYIGSNTYLVLLVLVGVARIVHQESVSGQET